MNDRLKFRVWSNEHKMFIKDHNYPIGSDYMLILNQEGELIELGLGDYEDYSDDTHSWGTYNKYDNCTVQFSTGLKDKNGKLIFEGDILKEYNPYEKKQAYIQLEAFKLRVVQYDEGLVGLTPFCYENPDRDLFYNAKDFEVVGNISEHPQIMEGKIYLDLCNDHKELRPKIEKILNDIK